MQWKKQSMDIKDSKCPTTVQRQQQHQQQARNSERGETQGSQVILMRRRSGSTGMPAGRFLLYFYLLSRQIWLWLTCSHIFYSNMVQDEHDEGGDRASMLRYWKRKTPSRSWRRWLDMQSIWLWLESRNSDIWKVSNQAYFLHTIFFTKSYWNAVNTTSPLEGIFMFTCYSVFLDLSSF